MGAYFEPKILQIIFQPSTQRPEKLVWRDVILCDVTFYVTCTLDRVEGEKLIVAHCCELDMDFNRPKILFDDVFGKFDHFPKN